MTQPVAPHPVPTAPARPRRRGPAPLPFAQLCPRTRAEWWRGARKAELSRYAARPRSNPARFLAGYRARLARLPRLAVTPSRPVIDALAQVLGPRGTITIGGIGELTGLSPRFCRPIYADTCRRAGQVPMNQRGRCAMPSDPLVPLLTRRLGPLPDTHLAAGEDKSLPAPILRAAVRVAALRAPALRMAASLVLTFAANRGVLATRQGHIARCFDYLDALLADADPLDPDGLTAALSRFLSDDSLSPRRRHSLWSAWAQAFGQVDAYLAAHPAIAARYRPWRIVFPYSWLKWEARALKREAARRAEARRHARCSPVVEDRGAILACYETRFTEISSIRSAFDAHCAEIRQGALHLRNGRTRFSLTLPCSTRDGAPTRGDTTLDFAIVTADYLVRRIAYVGAAALLRRPGDDLFLVYLGTRSGEEPPLLTMYRMGCFHGPANSEQRRVCETLLPAPDWPTSRRSYLMFRFLDRHRGRAAMYCFKAGVTLIPIGELHFTLAVGRAIAHSVLAGARLGEVMQQRHENEGFRASELVETAYEFDAIPKAKREAEPYLLGPKAFETIVTVTDVARANGWSTRNILPEHGLRHKCDRGAYLYQRNGRVLDPGPLSMAVRLPLWPRVLASHDLRHGEARNLRRRGHDAREIAIFLHHSLPESGASGDDTMDRDAAVHGYCTPTRHMLAEVHALIHANQEKAP